MSESQGERQISFGETVYDDEGNELGSVRGLDEHGFYVSTVERVVAMSVEHKADSRSGTKELHWRCWECGELGELSAGDLPDECPSCGAPKEELYYWQQD
jgi:rubrerythrin